MLYIALTALSFNIFSLYVSDQEPCQDQAHEEEATTAHLKTRHSRKIMEDPFFSGLMAQWAYWVNHRISVWSIRAWAICPWKIYAYWLMRKHYSVVFIFFFLFRFILTDKNEVRVTKPLIQTTELNPTELENISHISLGSMDRRKIKSHDA